MDYQVSNNIPALQVKYQYYDWLTEENVLLKSNDIYIKTMELLNIIEDNVKVWHFGRFAPTFFTHLSVYGLINL